MRTAVILSHAPVVAQQEPLAGHVPEILRQLGYEPIIRSFVAGTAPAEHVDLLLVMGSFESVLDQKLPWLRTERDYIRAQQDRGVPVIGICFGAQLLAQLLGGQVGNATEAENGFYWFSCTPESFVDAGPWAEFHYQCFTLPPGATLLAYTPVANQAFVQGKNLGLQFHLELTADAAELLLTEEPTMLTAEQRHHFLRQLAAEAETYQARGRRVLETFLQALA